MSKSAKSMLVVLAVIVHFGLGIAGLIGDLPADTRPDEADFVERIAGIVASGDPNPRYFFYPGGPHIYANAGLFAVSFGFSNPGQPFAEHFQQQRLYYYSLVRLFGLASTSLSVAVVFALARLLFRSYVVASIAAWFAALSPLLIAYSTYARNDASTTVLALLAVYHIARYWSRQTPQAFFASACFAGLATGNRYFMAFFVGYAALALLVIGSVRKEAWTRIAASAVGYGGIALAAFLVGNPFIVVEHEIALRDARIQGRTTHLGADGLSPVGNFLWYLSNTLPEGLTLPQVGLAAVGFVSALSRRRAELMWFVFLPLGYIAATSVLPLHWHRWVLQALPFLSILAGYGAERLLNMSGTLRSVPIQRLGKVCLLVALVWAGAQSLTYAVWRTAPTTRQQAGVWIAAHLPTGSVIHQQPYGALLPPGQFEVKGLKIPVPTPAQLAAQGVDYVVLSSAIYGRHRAEPHRYPNVVRSLDVFTSQAKLLKAFHPPRECHIELMVTLCGGPTLLIYEVSQPASQ